MKTVIQYGINVHMWLIYQTSANDIKVENSCHNKIDLILRKYHKNYNITKLFSRRLCDVESVTSDNDAT